MQNKIFNLIVVVLSACILLSFFVFTNNTHSLLVTLRSVNKLWIIIALVCMLIFWLLEAIILHIITTILYNTHNLFYKSIKFAMIGQFFGSLTPFASGSQPAQLYAMTEYGIPAGTSGSILMIKFIIHQTVFTIYSLLVMVLKFSYFQSKIKYFIYFALVGFSFNTLIIIIAFLFSSNDKLTKKLLLIILTVLSKIRLVKNPQQKYEDIEKELMSFHKNSAIIGKNKLVCLNASILTFIQWTIFYSIPYCVYRSFGFNSAGIFTMISAQIFLTIIMSCVPLPGGEGAAEGGFFIIFKLFFPQNLLLPAIFLWRILSYYSCIAAGCLFAFVKSSSSKIKPNKA
ncbi:lysylphosphatidylglycerol synthase transmembrane domain-containing protein [Clostridium guangxiense]|uniref:lysylphosphatidylglycerol synthase transmembrane domain-containing protein n=2 Tax=Clostridium TaxID=1485 RepID=UPI001E2ADBD7|nr:lysylphosphatidylglycerol synthase transmembrane domain-containing protein [Clostridium guangxiense]MCD2345619.1 flippase-like domain-containing protein [Clostridium guangxiense]